MTLPPTTAPVPPGSRPDSSCVRWCYAGLDEETRAQAVALDRRVWGSWSAWFGVLGGWAAAAVGLHHGGMRWAWAMLTAGLFVSGSVMAMRRAWLEPQRFDGRTLRRLAGLIMLATYAGALGTILAGIWDDAGGWPGRERLVNAMWLATPVQLLAGMALLLVLWAMATGRRTQIQRALRSAELVAERDAAARKAAEAQLQLLHAQIRPHFIFNTLAALQHWVDTGDARAPGFLRALTGFLRSSTEMLTRDEVTLDDELVMAQHYLAIMRARVGDRLHTTIDVDESSLQQALPPGLLLTLVENAVEHGITPALRPGSVSIAARTDAAGFELVVLNGGQALAEDWRDGLGLTNCRERLAHRFGTSARLELSSGLRGTEARVMITQANTDRRRDVSGRSSRTK